MRAAGRLRYPSRHMAACPICRSAAPRASENPFTPFCSERCKLIDLANWLDGAYRFDESSPLIPAPEPATESES